MFQYFKSLGPILRFLAIYLSCHSGRCCCRWDFFGFEIRKLKINWFTTNQIRPGRHKTENKNIFFPGVGAQNQADSYKRMVDGEFVYGVEKLWVLAPTRHGAHNWEGPGEMTSLRALHVLAELTWKSRDWLGKSADQRAAVFAGHSMGGHGAWWGVVTKCLFSFWWIESSQEYFIVCAAQLWQHLNYECIPLWILTRLFQFTEIH